VTDRREFIKLDIGYLSNPKIAGLLLDRRPLAVLLHVECMTYSRQHRTDGVVPAALAMRSVVGSTRRDLTAAVDAGLLIDLGDGKVEVHDYAKHQETREEIEARSEAGRTGAAARWGKAKRSADRNADRSPDGNAEERRGEEREKKDISSEVADATPRPDVEKLLDHLDDRIRANGAKVPNRTKRNREAARLLLDRDEHTVDQVLAAIDFATSDEFWRTNVLSMSKLREKYDQLRLAATRKGRAPAAARPPVIDQWRTR
jgi:hypothetical protein